MVATRTVTKYRITAMTATITKYMTTTMTMTTFFIACSGKKNKKRI